MHRVRQYPCTCPGALVGASTCQSDGTFSACVCAPPVPFDASIPFSDAAVDAGPEPFDLENPTQCMRKENTLYVYGEPGAVGFPAQSGERNNPAFSTVVDIASAAPSDEMTIHFAAEPSGAEHGGDQFYLFSLRNLKTPMQKGVTYEDAKGQTIENVTNPIQEIFGGCSSKTQTGRFRFHELELKPNLRPARF